MKIFVLLLLVGLVCVQGRVWGSKARREIVDEPIVVDDAIPDFDLLTTNRTLEFPTADVFDMIFRDVESTKIAVRALFAMLREAINDTSFDDVFSLQSVRETVNSIPELASNVEIQQVLRSKELKDPQYLRSMILMSLEMMELEALRLLTSPDDVLSLLNTIPSLLENLPEDAKDYIQSITELYYLALEDDSSDSNLLATILQIVIEDDDLLESLRLALLEHPFVLEYTKIPPVAIQDSSMWKVYMRSIATMSDIFNWDKQPSNNSSSNKKKKRNKRIPSMFGEGDRAL